MRDKEEEAGKRSSFAIEMELIQFVALETGTNPSSHDSRTAIQYSLIVDSLHFCNISSLRSQISLLVTSFHINRKS